MYEHTADLVYDLLNVARGKDYPGEAEAVLDIVRSHSGAARTLLDVGCGTGRHLVELTARGLECVGADVSPEMLARARRRVGDLRLELADIRSLSLGMTFDAVICLNGTIGYMTTGEDLRAAVGSLARHRAPDGVLIIEPWFAPHQWLAPMVTAESTKDGDIAVARVSRAVRGAGHLGVFEWLCSVATPARTWSFTEVHELGLYEIGEYVAAVEHVGLHAEHVPLPGGRGLGVIVATAHG